MWTENEEGRDREGEVIATWQYAIFCGLKVSGWDEEG